MKGYKKIETGYIPDCWEFLHLSKIATTFSGGTPKSDNAEYYINGDIPFIKSGEIHKTCTEQFITEEGFKNSSAKIIKKGDILYALYGANSGDVCISKQEGAINQAILCLRTDQNKNFIVEMLRLNYEKIVNKFLQGGQGNLSAQIIKKIKVPLPPLEEQKAIADCLSTWDKAIELQRQLILSKEARKKSLAQQLLTGKRRLPGFTGERKEESYGKLLSQIKRKENWEDNHLYHLISVRRRSGGIFHRESLYGHQIAVKELMKVKKDDFLISKMQILHGASSIVNQEFENFYVSGSYIILNVTNPKKLSPDYLDFYSKQKIFYHQTYISSYGVHIEKMTFDFKTFLKMNMILPSIEEQNAIVKVLETADKELQLEKQKLADLQQQKRALMQQLLTGKVRLV